MAELTTTDPQKAAEADDINYTICERTPEAYGRGLKHYLQNGSVNNGINYPHAYFEGVVAICEGDRDKARNAFNVARGEIAAVVVGYPRFAPAFSSLVMIDVGFARPKTRFHGTGNGGQISRRYLALVGIWPLSTAHDKFRGRSTSLRTVLLSPPQRFECRPAES